jgi:hypothetical protein
MCGSRGRTTISPRHPAAPGCRTRRGSRRCSGAPARTSRSFGCHGVLEAGTGSVELYTPTSSTPKRCSKRSRIATAGAP